MTKKCEEHIYLDNLSFAVIDEGDTLLEKPFDQPLRLIFNNLKVGHVL